MRFYILALLIFTCSVHAAEQGNSDKISVKVSGHIQSNESGGVADSECYIKSDNAGRTISNCGQWSKVSRKEDPVTGEITEYYMMEGSGIR